jgi:hypothetical protein
MFAKFVQGYPVYYINNINECLCSECAEENNSNYAEYQDNYNKERSPISQHVNWENNELYCDKCSVQIESYYELEDKKNEHS